MKSGEQIAKENGWTRQYVSNTLKSAMGKMYYKLRKKNPDMSGFEIINALRNYFDMNNAEDIESFYRLFPPKVKKEVLEEVNNEA